MTLPSHQEFGRNTCDSPGMTPSISGSLCNPEVGLQRLSTTYAGDQPLSSSTLVLKPNLLDGHIRHLQPIRISFS